MVMNKHASMGLSLAVIAGLGCADPGALDEAAQAEQPVVYAPNLQVRLTAPLTGLTGANATYQVTVQNFGNDVAAYPQVVLTLAPGVSVVSLPAGCAAGPSPQQVTCGYGSLLQGASASKSLLLSLPAAPGTATFTAAVSTATPESTTSDNGASTYTWVNLATPDPLSLRFTPTPQVLDSWVCVDPGTDIAQCPRTQLRVGLFAIDANGTMRLPPSQVGTWTQPTGPESLAFEVRSATDNALLVWWSTRSVGANCVQGDGVSAGVHRAVRFCARP